MRDKQVLEHHLTNRGWGNLNDAYTAPFELRTQVHRPEVYKGFGAVVDLSRPFSPAQSKAWRSRQAEAAHRVDDGELHTLRSSV